MENLPAHAHLMLYGKIPKTRLTVKPPLSRQSTTDFKPYQPSHVSDLWSPPPPTLPRADTVLEPHVRRAASKDVVSRRASAADGPRRVATFCCVVHASSAAMRGCCAVLNLSDWSTAACRSQGRGSRRVEAIRVEAVRVKAIRV